MTATGWIIRVIAIRVQCVFQNDGAFRYSQLWYQVMTSVWWQLGPLSLVVMGALLLPLSACVLFTEDSEPELSAISIEYFL